MAWSRCFGCVLKRTNEDTCSKSERAYGCKIHSLTSWHCAVEAIRVMDEAMVKRPLVGWKPLSGSVDPGLRRVVQDGGPRPERTRCRQDGVSFYGSFVNCSFVASPAMGQQRGAASLQGRNLPKFHKANSMKTVGVRRRTVVMVLKQARSLRKKTCWAAGPAKTNYLGLGRHGLQRLPRRKETCSDSARARERPA